MQKQAMHELSFPATQYMLSAELFCCCTLVLLPVRCARLPVAFPRPFVSTCLWLLLVLGCCPVATCLPDVTFCWTLLSKSGLCACNGPRPELQCWLPCVRAVAPGLPTASAATSEARLVLRSEVVRAGNFLPYVVRRACLTYLQCPAAENSSPAAMCSCSLAFPPTHAPAQTCLPAHRQGCACPIRKTRTYWQDVAHNG